VAKISRIRQAKQARNSEAYDDQRPNGPVMETDPVDLEADLNNIRSQVNRILDKSLAGNWFDEPVADLQEILAIASRRYKQPLAGAINGVNTVFTVATKFRHDGVRNEAVYYNGVCLQEGAGMDYVASESMALLGYDTITLEFAPKPGDNLAIDYTPV
jgi:hypothetical protein